MGNLHHGFTYLNIWSLLGGPAWECCGTFRGDRALLEEIYYWTKVSNNLQPCVRPHSHPRHFLSVLFVILTQGRVIWKEGLLIKKMLQSNWPIGVGESFGHFLD